MVFKTFTSFISRFGPWLALGIVTAVSAILSAR